MIILGIETSCDDTSASLVERKSGHEGAISQSCFHVLSSLVSSQVKIHAKTGGIVPEVAAREHIKNILPIINEALKKAGKKPKDISAIAVTAGPGLITSLIVGVETAKTLAFVWNKPLIPINHLEGHIYANFLENKNIKFPLLALIVSGGHTQLVLMKRHLRYQTIGETRDDAAGEAFDKVAKLMNLGYPGGPVISRLARKGNGSAFKLPRPMINDKNFDFSFSGLKTAVLYEIRSGAHNFNRANNIADLCASFEQAAVDVLVSKTIRAALKYKPKTVLLAGGVAANKLLRKTMENEITAIGKRSSRTVPSLLIPNSCLCTDNAAMIAAAGHFHDLKRESGDWRKIKVDPNWELD